MPYQGPQRTITRDQIPDQVQQSIQDGIDQGNPGRVTVTTQAPVGIATTEYPPPWVGDVPPRAADVAIASMVMLGVVIIGFPIARALARRIDRTGISPRVPVEVTSQLAQLNQAVESIAIEVERISEGQRFTTKLLSEQHSLPTPNRNVS